MMNLFKILKLSCFLIFFMACNSSNSLDDENLILSDEDILNTDKIIYDIQNAMKVIGKKEMQKLMKTCDWDT